MTNTSTWPGPCATCSVVGWPPAALSHTIRPPVLRSGTYTFEPSTCGTPSAAGSFTANLVLSTEFDAVSTTTRSPESPGVSSGTSEPSVEAGASTPPLAAWATSLGSVISPTPPSAPMIVAVAARVLTITGRPPAIVTASSSPGSPTLTAFAATPLVTGTTSPFAVTGTQSRPPPSIRAEPSGPGSDSGAPTELSVAGSIC